MNGFEFKLTINKIDGVKPRQSGESEINGDNVVWGWAVKFNTRNKKLVDDDDFGQKQVEDTLVIEVRCKDKEETIKLNNFLLALSNDPKPFLCDIELPTKSGNEYKAKAVLDGDNFIKLFSKK